MANKIGDRLWLVEYNKHRGNYRICRFVEPDRAIAYEDYYQDAVRDIRSNYGDDVIIFIRDYVGSVQCWHEDHYL